VLDPFSAFKGLDKKSRTKDLETDAVVRRFRLWPRIVTIWKQLDDKVPAFRVYRALAQRWEEIHGEFMETGTYHKGEGAFVLNEIFKSPLKLSELDKEKVALESKTEAKKHIQKRSKQTEVPF